MAAFSAGEALGSKVCTAIPLASSFFRSPATASSPEGSQAPPFIGFVVTIDGEN
jgi:hypothetical protein